MTGVFVFLVATAIIYGAKAGTLKFVNKATFDSAKDGATLAIQLIGVMAFFLGLMRVLEVGGLMRWLANALTPIARKLFPDVPAGHPAMGAILLNISANMLGLGNAATPFGLKAMGELAKLSNRPGVATNSMCMFLAINTSSVTLLPLGVIGVRAAAGAIDPTAIFIPSLLATTCSTAVAIILGLIFAHFSKDSIVVPSIDRVTKTAELSSDKHSLVSSSLGKFIGLLLPSILLIIFVVRTISSPQPLQFFSGEFCQDWFLPTLLVSIIAFGLYRGVNIYEEITEGAKEGFQVAIRIIPFLVTILVAIGIFRASGLLDVIIQEISPFTSLVGLPAETLPVALIRPLSGSGSFAVMSALIYQDPNSYASYVASVMQGSTETTFYVLAVYFGSIGITRIRYTLFIALVADIVGLLSSCWWSALFYTAP
jgi:spore maturation protein SpmA